MEISAPVLEDPALEAYEALAPFYDLFTDGYSYDTLLAELERLALDHGLAGRRLLDVGCGTGKSFLPMLARGYEVAGCDLSPAMVELAREKLPPGLVDLFVADMRDLPAGRAVRPHHLPRRRAQLPGGPGRPRARPERHGGEPGARRSGRLRRQHALHLPRGVRRARRAGVRRRGLLLARPGRRGLRAGRRGERPAGRLPRAGRRRLGAGSPSTTTSATCPGRSWSPPCARPVCELLAVRGLVPGGHLVPDADEDRHVKLVFLARAGAGAPSRRPQEVNS